MMSLALSAIYCGNDKRPEPTQEISVARAAKERKQLQAVEAVAGDWYPAEVLQLRARDGGIVSVEADRHPDPLVSEGEESDAIRRKPA